MTTEVTSVNDNKTKINCYITAVNKKYYNIIFAQDVLVFHKYIWINEMKNTLDRTLFPARNQCLTEIGLTDQNTMQIEKSEIPLWPKNVTSYREKSNLTNSIYTISS